MDSDLHPDAQYVMREIAKFPEGRVALALLVRSELDKIGWHISGAIARCAVADARGDEQ